MFALKRQFSDIKLISRVYYWVDEKGKRVKVAAPTYIDYVMTYTQKTVNDETLFPTKFGMILSCLLLTLLTVRFR